MMELVFAVVCFLERKFGIQLLQRGQQSRFKEEDVLLLLL
jgi:hypothetical protein